MRLLLTAAAAATLNVLSFSLYGFSLKENHRYTKHTIAKATSLSKKSSANSNIKNMSIIDVDPDSASLVFLVERSQEDMQTKNLVHFGATILSHRNRAANHSNLQSDRFGEKSVLKLLCYSRFPCAFAVGAASMAD